MLPPGPNAHPSSTQVCLHWDRGRQSARQSLRPKSLKQSREGWRWFLSGLRSVSPKTVNTWSRRANIIQTGGIYLGLFSVEDEIQFCTPLLPPDVIILNSTSADVASKNANNKQGNPNVIVFFEISRHRQRHKFKMYNDTEALRCKLSHFITLFNLDQAPLATSNLSYLSQYNK